MKASLEPIPWTPPLARPAAAFPLAPLLAGARARGVADGLEWLGLAAVLIDDRGEALHVNAGAVELMGQALYLEDGRLRAADPETDACLNEAIRETVSRGLTSVLTISSADGLGGVEARIAPMDALGDDPCQLLRAIAILEPAGRA